MRLCNAVLAGAALALAPMVAAGPALAQDNGPLGQVQRLLNGNNDNQRNAYEQGRVDQQRREQAERDRTRHEHADEDRRPERRGRYEAAPQYREGYNQGGSYDNGRGSYDNGRGSYDNGPAYDPNRR